jgi:hypothetical protein
MKEGESQTVDKQNQFYPPGTILVTANGVPYRLVAGQGWTLMTQEELQAAIDAENQTLRTNS